MMASTLRRVRKLLIAIPLAGLLATGAFAAGTLPTDPPGAIAGVFTKRSYAPGENATLVLLHPVKQASIALVPASELSGGITYIRSSGTQSGSRLRVGIPARASSGLYFALVRAGEHSGQIPLIVRPAHLGEKRVLVVLPTNTWEAYNFRGGDSWYFDASVHVVDLTRPFFSPGLPPHYAGYDLGFQVWLAKHDKHPDVISDDDLDAVASGDALARDYDLIVFPGHEEYVTAHMYDVIQRYRDLGGNLAFLSANNFFYKVIHSGNRITGRWRWRDLGRPEAKLIGAQYVDWNHQIYKNKPYTVTGVENAPWLFRGTGLHDGSTISGTFGIEIDAKDSLSPAGTRVLATIRNEFGPGKSAEMTYYETPRGAKVFAAGTINFGGAARRPAVAKMLENLWDRLRHP
jgi:hypothetical protein